MRGKLVGMNTSLQTIVQALQSIAPLRFAETWDNIGLLVAPTAAHARPVRRILLTIDLTDAVMAEAIRKNVEMIVAYHPPIFEAIKRAEELKPVVLRAIEKGIAIYSPHTALDVAPGGVNDWLADGLGDGERQPLRPTMALPESEQCKIVVFVPVDHVDHLRNALAEIGVGGIGDYHHCSFNIEGIGTFWASDATHPAVGRKGLLERVPEIRLEMIASPEMLPSVAHVIRKVHPYEEPAWEAYKLEPHPMTGFAGVGTGQGRRITLNRPTSLNTLVMRVKKHLGLKHVRVAQANGHGVRGVRTIALCAGAGSSVLKEVTADVYMTGEMRHHDVLDATGRGTSVILCDHTHTERGYLPISGVAFERHEDGAITWDLGRPHTITSIEGIRVKGPTANIRYDIHGSSSCWGPASNHVAVSPRRELAQRGRADAGRRTAKRPPWGASCRSQVRHADKGRQLQPPRQRCAVPRRDGFAGKGPCTYCPRAASRIAQRFRNRSRRYQLLRAEPRRATVKNRRLERRGVRALRGSPENNRQTRRRRQRQWSREAGRC